MAGGEPPSQLLGALGALAGLGGAGTFLSLFLLIIRTATATATIATITTPIRMYSSIGTDDPDAVTVMDTGTSFVTLPRVALTKRVTVPELDPAVNLTDDVVVEFNVPRLFVSVQT